MQVTSVEFKKWLYLALFCFLLLVDSDKFFADEIKKVHRPLYLLSLRGTPLIRLSPVGA